MWKSKFYGAFASSPRNDLVKNYRVHPTHSVVDFHTGVINDIEKTCPSVAKRMDRFGTCFTLGRGYHVTMQRFGAGADDKRTCLFYHINRPDGEEGVLRDGP